MEKYRLLFESVFKRKLTDTDTVGYLERIAAEHPYFSVAQFYRLQLMQKESTAYPLQAIRTALLFNNNYWLNFQLLEADSANKEEPQVSTSAQTPEPEVQSISSLQAIEETASETIVADQLEEHLSLQMNTTAPAGQEDNKLAEAFLPEAEIHTPAGSSAVEERIENVQVQEVSPVAGFEQATTITEEPIAAAIEIIEPSNAVPAATMEDKANIDTKIAADDVKTTFAEGQETFGDKAKEGTQEAITETIVAEKEINLAESSGNKIAPTVPEPTIENLEIPATTGILEKTPEIIDTNTAQKNTAEALVFEPLHTSDYFASVGIKLSEEEKTSDKLGKQLKSFTDWLKTMKKVHAQQSFQASKPAGVEAGAADSNIQKLAEKSNQEGEILTEAMADVLMQQGRGEKAIEILQKLSLLNPGKSAYFAAKINQIKEN